MSSTSNSAASERSAPRTSTSSPPPPYSTTEKFYGTSNTSKNLVHVFTRRKSSDSNSSERTLVSKPRENKEPYYAARAFYMANR